jgi:PAS domain S-box-containing protein
LAFVLSTLVLIGWSYQVSVLKTLLPGRPDMKANAALCFLFLGVGIALTRPQLSRSFQKAGRIFTMFVFLFSIVVLCEYLFHVTFFIDEFLFSDPNGMSGHSPPGRYSSMTALNFFVLSLAVLISTGPKWRWEKTAQGMAMLVFLTALISSLGNALGTPNLFGMGVFMPMAIHTGFIFVVLSAAFLSARWERGLTKPFSAATSGAVMARQMFVAIIAVPLLLRIFTFMAEDRGLFSHDIGVFIRVMGGEVFMALVVLGSAAALWRAEQESAKLRMNEKRNAEQLKLITDSQPALISYIGPDLRYQVVNRGYIDWFGKDKNSFVGKTIDEALGKENARGFREHLQFVQPEVMDKLNHEIKIQDGRVLQTQTTFVPDRNEDGAACGYVVITRDVTETLHAQRDLESAKIAAEEASLAKSQFLANMSHEIRTPLGVILGFSDLALESIDQPDEVKEFLQTIRRNAGELSNLIGDILDLSKVEANKLEIEQIEFELEPLLTEVTASLSAAAAEKDLRFTVHRQEPLPVRITSDPTRLRQILMNLLGNAIKFTPRGHVELAVFAQEGHPHFLSFRVSDSGIGVSNEQQVRLFKPFSQADNSMTRKFGGTGLGLMLSKQLAQALGGDLVLISSELGVGSVFEARIAVGNLSMAKVSTAVPGHVSADAIDLRSLNVLLVEDVEENQWLVEAYLKPTGLKLTIAENGARALECVSASEFDIVLMDIQMPVMDGYKATSLLRAGGFGKPIIALTAHAIEQEREKALALGFTAYLTKPLSRDALLKTLVELTVS